VERAQALETAQPGALEGHIPVNDFLDVGTLADFVDIFTFDQSSHKDILDPGYDNFG
jgi:hypothetical protein